MQKFQTTIIWLAVLLVAQNEISASVAREKRSFPWPSFLGGNSVAPETPSAPAEDAAADVSYDTADEINQQVLQQQQIVQQQAFLEQLQQQDVQPQQSYAIPNAVPQQQLVNDPNIVYHYPIWRVHKYNGIDLKPIPVSLLPAHLQPAPATESETAPAAEPVGYVQPSELDPQTTGYEIAEGSERFERTIPDELRKIAIMLGIPDFSKLPSLEDAMNLLGATTQEETISIIKELAATESGRELIKQFLQGNNDADGDETDGAEEQQQLTDEQQQLTDQQQQFTDQQQQLTDYHQQLLQLQKPQEIHFAQQDIQKQQQQQLHDQLIQQNQIQQQLTQQNQIQQQQADRQLQLEQQQQQYQRQPDDHHQHLDPSDVAPHTDQNLPAAYGPPPIRQPNQYLLPPTFRSTVGAGLDRAHTDLGLYQNIITTPKPDGAGFFQRITHFLKPPAATVDLQQFEQAVPAISPAQTFHHNPQNPTIRLQEPQQFQPQHPSAVNPSLIRTIPIPKVPALTEPHVDGFNHLLPSLPQLPQLHIPPRFRMPAEQQQQPAQTYVIVRYPIMAFNPVPDMHSVAEPLEEANSAAVGNGVETILLEQPDISQLPLDNFTAFRNAPQIVTSYGTPALPYDDDTDVAASEHVATVVRAPNTKEVAQPKEEAYRVEGDQTEFRPSAEDATVTLQRRSSHRPQRISSYDSYATGKINRADADAVQAAIPTQSPADGGMMRSLPAFGE